MWVYPCHHIHAKTPRSLNQSSKRIGVAEVRAAMVIRNAGGIERHVPACAEAKRIRPRVPHHIDPEVYVQAGGIIVGESQLGPARGAAVPVRRAQIGRASGRESA